VAYQHAFLDEYLKLELSENIYAFMGKFDTGGIGKQDYSTVLATHRIKAYADLIRSYEYGTHTLEWEAYYEKQDYLGDGLSEYDTLERSLRKDFLSQKPFDDRIALALNQYWQTNTLDLQAKQRISQTYYPDRNEKWGDLRHELALDYGKWSVINLTEYSFAYNNFSEMSNKVLYRDEKLYLNLEHFWRKDLELGAILTNEFAFDATYQYNKQIKIFGSMTYDLEKERSKKWESSILYDKGCWSVELSYIHDTKPILEKNGGGSLSNNTFLVKLNLVPFGESEIRQ